MADEQQQNVVIGIDLGGTKALAGAVAADNSIAGQAKISTRKSRSPEALLAEIAACARKAVDNAGLPYAAVRAAGIGVPGPIDPATGAVKTAPNLGWHDVPVKTILERELGVPVAVDNDVRVATLGEHQLGAGRGYSRVVTFFVGTGIGGGLVIDGQIYRGAHNAAGEIGHTFVAPGGPRCGAGHSGCLEAMASRTAIQRDIIAAVGQGKRTALSHIVAGNLANMKSSDLAEALAHDDKLAKRILKRAAQYLGYGIASAVNLIDPDVVILGGGVIEAVGDPFVAWATKVARPNCISPASRDIPIVCAALGDDAGMLGAALLARETVEG